MSIQNSFDLLATNMQEEVESIKEKSEIEKKSDKNASPEKIQETINAIQKRSKGILNDLDQVSSMESDLKEKGADVPS